MTFFAGAALIAAGCALAYHASVVEQDGPGWRNDLAGVLAVAGVLTVAKAVRR